jgi:hypothetical protein
MDGWEGERRKKENRRNTRMSIFNFLVLLSHLPGSLAVDGQRGKESLYSGILLFGEREK